MNDAGAPLGRALGLRARRLGDQRGPADAGLRGGAARRRPAARRAGARRRLRDRRLPAPVRRPRRGGRPAWTRPQGCSTLPAPACPDADLQPADMVELPFADDTFDLVTGFTSFFFADDIVRALSEARRVARPGAAVVAEVFGHPDRCDLEAVKAAVMRFRDGRAASTGARTPSSRCCRRPAFGSSARSTSTCAYRYAGRGVARRGHARRGRRRRGRRPGARGRAARRDRRRGRALPPADGSYHLANEWHVVVARA